MDWVPRIVNAPDVLTILTQSLLVLIAVLTAADWIRQRGRVRLKISLLFLSLASSILIGLLTDLGFQVGQAGRLISLAGMLAHPFLLLWLLSDLYPVGRLALLAAAAGLAALLLAFSLAAEAAPPALVGLAVAYFASIEVAAALLILRLARIRQGVLRRRMVLVAAGSGLLAAAIMLLGLMVLLQLPPAWGQAGLAVLASASAICYYLGFVPPGWLRRAWLLNELERFLSSASALAQDSDARKLIELLTEAAERATGSSASMLGCHQPETDSLAFATGSELPLEAGDHQSLLRGRSIHLSTFEEQPVALRDLASESNASSAYLMPIHAGPDMWGAVLLFPRGRTLFPWDDLALLDLLGRQTSVQLGYRALLEQERHLSDALKEQNNLLVRNELYLAQMRDPVWIVDNDNRTVDVNPAFEAMFGFGREEVLGREVFGFFDEDNQAILRAEFARRAQGQTSTYEVSLTNKHGASVPIIITGSPIVQDGAVVGKIGVLKDIRAQKELEAELRMTARRLEAVNHELEAFSYSVSHDLRGPLRAVDGFSRILLEEHAADLDDEARSMLERIRANAQRMGEMITHLLAFSRLGRQGVDLQPLDVNALVTEALEEVQAEWEGSPVKIELHSLPRCRGDRVLLKRVFANLISNAAKFSRHAVNPLIEIGAEARNGATVYYVKDNGVGFDMAYVDKLFGVFQRLHRQEDFEGTGVGLATVQRIIHRHGGRIWPESRPEAGATFFFTIGQGEIHDRSVD